MHIQAFMRGFSPDMKRAGVVLAMLCAMIFAPPGAVAANCKDTQTQFDINRCAAEAFHKADKDLNKIYQKALKKQRAVDASKIENFKNIQRAWIKYRDLQCGYASAVYEGGSMAPAVQSGCMEELTKQRIQVIPHLFGEWE